MRRTKCNGQIDKADTEKKTSPDTDNPHGPNGELTGQHCIDRLYNNAILGVPRFADP